MPGFWHKVVRLAEAHRIAARHQLNLLDHLSAVCWRGYMHAGNGTAFGVPFGLWVVHLIPFRALIRH